MADEKELSLSDEIGAALDAVDQTPDAPVDASEAPVEASEGRSRDEHGRFAPKEAAPVEGQAAPPTPSTEQAQTVTVPASWSKEDAAVFATLPPATQAVIARREQERDRGFQQAMQNIAGVERFHQALQPILTEYQPLIQSTGAPPEQIIKELFTLYAFSQNDPDGYYDWLGQQLGKTSPNNAPDEYTDPALAELRQGYQRLNETVTQFETRLKREDEAKKQAEVERDRQFVTTWANQRNQDGSEKHPHFADRKVQTYMGTLMQLDKELDLDRAYEQATRALGLQNPTPQPQKQPVPNLSSKGAGTGTRATPTNLRDTIADALDQIH